MSEQSQINLNEVLSILGAKELEIILLRRQVEALQAALKAKASPEES